MADEQVKIEREQDSGEVAALKQDLEGYREFILPLKQILEWEQSHYPVVLVGAITFVFSIIWYLELSVLTLICLVGLFGCIIDFTIPAISSHLFSSAEWTVVQERQLEAICARLLNAKKHLNHIKTTLADLKRSKPKVYLVAMMVAFALLAWFGSLIDNLLLVYLLVVIVALLPGLRKHGILQKASEKITETIAGLKKGQEKSGKTKTN